MAKHSPRENSNRHPRHRYRHNYWRTSFCLHCGRTNTCLWRKSPEAVTVRIRTDVQGQVWSIRQVPYQQEGLGDESKPEDKDSITDGTARAYVEGATTTEESAVPNGTPSIGSYVSETNIQLSNSSRAVKKILGAHSINNDDFWDNTNSTDVSIDTANSEEMMAGSHIAKFHTFKQEGPVTTELLNKASNVPELTGKDDTGEGHHN